MVAQEQRQWAQAEQYYQQALAIQIEYNDRYGQATVYHQLGMVVQEQQQWAQAEQYYQQALAIFIEFGDRYNQAGTYHQLGVIAQRQRQRAYAEQYYQQALAIFIEFGDRYSQAGTYHQWGMIAHEQQDWEQAEQYYQQALVIFLEYKDQYNLQVVLRSLARLWHESGDDALASRVAVIMDISVEDVEARFSSVLFSTGLSKEQRKHFEPLLQAVAAVTYGDERPRADIENILLSLEEQGWRISEPVKRIWQGERNLTTLMTGLDGMDKALVQRVLVIIEQKDAVEA
jgi:tetratricopeptide (TPR) repeat protein